MKYLKYTLLVIISPITLTIFMMLSFVGWIMEIDERYN